MIADENPSHETTRLREEANSARGPLVLPAAWTAATRAAVRKGRSRWGDGRVMLPEIPVSQESSRELQQQAQAAPMDDKRC